ncbi:hypothetical protein IFM89_000727 [Coptis chinensis]|uniref:Retrotransposon gag domain-containing protein n=1 Tax=Coptis chinensis TaxID=261450 RepID=A0A835IU90_9MAGN|nr:hypothetical protein IFM89_000727 [Coptis chinensis]
MAEARLKELLERGIDTKMAELHQRQDGVEEKVQIMQGTLESMMSNITNQFSKLNEKLEKQPEKFNDSRDQRGILGNPNGIFGAPNVIDLARRQCSNGSFGNYKLPRAEFPRFNGEEPRVWVKKCQRFFTVNPIAEDQKVLFDSLYFEGKVETWFQSFYETYEGITWDDFTKTICGRFSDEGYENVVGEFNKLQQMGSVASYQEKFEELMPLILEE